MIHHRLKVLAQVETARIPSGAHLDEDTICAFVEGRLGESESGPIVSHLIACGSCRRTSAQLIRLESQISAEDGSTAAEKSSSRVREFLEKLAAHVAPSSETDAVFAYQNPPGNPDQTAPVTPQSTPGKANRTESDAEGQIENKDS
jgi:hypothetical protein